MISYLVWCAWRKPCMPHMTRPRNEIPMQCLHTQDTVFSVHLICLHHQKNCCLSSILFLYVYFQCYRAKGPHCYPHYPLCTHCQHQRCLLHTRTQENQSLTWYHLCYLGTGPHCQFHYHNCHLERICPSHSRHPCHSHWINHAQNPRQSLAVYNDLN